MVFGLYSYEDQNGYLRLIIEKKRTRLQPHYTFYLQHEGEVLGAHRRRHIADYMVAADQFLGHLAREGGLGGREVEAAPRLLPGLSERISGTVQQELESLGVTVHVNTAIQEAKEYHLVTNDGEVIDTDLNVWAAGIKAPEFLAGIAGLETNRINQLAVNEYLQTTLDPRMQFIARRVIKQDLGEPDDRLVLEVTAPNRAHQMIGKHRHPSARIARHRPLGLGDTHPHGIVLCQTFTQQTEEIHAYP